jgi:hypothetical protein
MRRPRGGKGMDEFVYATVKSRPSEGPVDFQKRLIAFWTHILRTRPDDYAQVYAETSRFESSGDVVTRQYMVSAGVADVLAEELRRAGIDHDPINLDDLYSKFEAAPPEWFQIPH